ncbi:MAG TPA: hypothetical protein VFW48_00860, partial [Solirubrobacterales bacterium]|nr:hypothetical protein [Solirubrobacterales bacterium]
DGCVIRVDAAATGFELKSLALVARHVSSGEVLDRYGAGPFTSWAAGSDRPGTVGVLAKLLQLAKPRRIFVNLQEEAAVRE